MVWFGVSPSVEYSSPRSGFIALFKSFVCPGTIIPTCSKSINPSSTSCPSLKTPFPKIKDVVLSVFVSRVNLLLVFIYDNEYGTGIESSSPLRVL